MWRFHIQAPQWRQTLRPPTSNSHLSFRGPSNLLLTIATIESKKRLCLLDIKCQSSTIDSVKAAPLHKVDSHRQTSTKTNPRSTVTGITTMKNSSTVTPVKSHTPNPITIYIHPALFSGERPFPTLQATEVIENTSAANINIAKIAAEDIEFVDFYTKFGMRSFNIATIFFIVLLVAYSAITSLSQRKEPPMITALQRL